ncbi:Monoacylglycerol lipase ABHD2-B [Liparis tanakae]|uniref:Monoacylglycerol lipase ABHD2-B n=1 Tax=Liparis tanakae TaxID=230148 RepID=A0A4Z2EGL3_9TELE|nr:Monoacylglycerol lipase ABHD2-B [Liparis tanakae]
MVAHVKRAFPQTLLVAVGFSLGGNIVCKFLGESPSNQDRVLCCVTVCQGYSAHRSVPPRAGQQNRAETRIDALTHTHIVQETFFQWDRCRRLYNFVLADRMKKLILSHRSSLLSLTSSNIGELELSRLYAATSLMQIDDSIMRKFHGYSSLKEYYEKESCMNYIHNVSGFTVIYYCYYYYYYYYYYCYYYYYYYCYYYSSTVTTAMSSATTSPTVTTSTAFAAVKNTAILLIILQYYISDYFSIIRHFI